MSQETLEEMKMLVWKDVYCAAMQAEAQTGRYSSTRPHEHASLAVSKFTEEFVKRASRY